jgi:hypothetical protein
MNQHRLAVRHREFGAYIFKAGEGVIPLPPCRMNLQGATLSQFGNQPGLDQGLQAGRFDAIFCVPEEVK